MDTPFWHGFCTHTFHFLKDKEVDSYPIIRYNLLPTEYIYDGMMEMMETLIQKAPIVCEIYSGAIFQGSN